MIQEQYQPVVAAARNWCCSRFGERLRGAFIAGSVAVGEAMPNVSDLDFFVFIEDEPCRGDNISQRRAEHRLMHTFPVVPVIHLNLHSVHRLLNEPFWRFILKYNAVQVTGTDVLAHCEVHATVKTPAPDIHLAQSRLPFVRTCLESVRHGQTPPALDQLPDNVYLAARKLARNFMVVEGAHLLMTKGRFSGFGQERVLNTLHILFPQWNHLVNLSKSVLEHPIQAGIGAPDYLEHLIPFVEWMIAEIETYPETSSSPS